MRFKINDLIVRLPEGECRLSRRPNDDDDDDVVDVRDTTEEQRSQLQTELRNALEKLASLEQQRTPPGESPS